MRMWRVALLALAGLRRSPLRVCLTALGVTIGSGALVSMVAFALGIQEQAEAPFRTLGLINIIRVSRRRDAKDAAVLHDAALARMEALPGVEVAYPDFRMRGIRIARGPKSAGVVAVGLPRHVPMLAAADEILVAGDYFTPGAAPEIILPAPLAAELGFKAPENALGATVTIKASGLAPGEATTFTFEQKDLPVTVVGIYQFHMMPGHMRKAVLLPVDLMKGIPGIRSAPAIDRLKLGLAPAEGSYTKATVRIRHHGDLARVERAIQAMGFRTRSLLSRLEQMRAFFVFMDVLLAAVGTVALVVAGLGIINTLLISVLERYQEIGICKAIGASDGDMVVLFLTEAGIIGLLGGIAGLLLGKLGSWVLELGVNAYARTQGVTAHLDLFAFPPWLLAATVLFSIAISVLAGVYPAFRAARVDPIQALRRD